jgi:hypothetical protein
MNYIVNKIRFELLTGLRKDIYGLSPIIKVLELEYGPPLLTLSHTFFTSLKKRGFSPFSLHLKPESVHFF